MSEAEGERAKRERNPIAALTRVLGAMAELDAPSIGTRELARILGSPPSSVQRTLESAHELSLVSTSGTGQWELGWELFRIASIVQRKRPFQAATAVLDELRTRTEETALLAVYDPERKERMFVASSPSTRNVRFVAELFSWLPMHAGASALAILAFRPEEERRALYAKGLPSLTATTLTSADDLELALADIRENGFAVSHDQVNLGASGVAFPVMSPTGVMSSVAVIAPAQRFDAAGEQPFIEHVSWAANVLSSRLGDPLTALRGVS